MVGRQVGYSATAEAVAAIVVHEANQVSGVLSVEHGDKLWYARWDGRTDRYANMRWYSREEGIGVTVSFMETPEDPHYPLPTEERYGVTYTNELILRLEESVIPEMVMARLERMVRPKLARQHLPLEVEWPSERDMDMNNLTMALRFRLSRSSNLWRIRELIEAILPQFPQFQGSHELCSHLVLGGTTCQPSISVDIETDVTVMWIWVTDGYQGHRYRNQLRIDLAEGSSRLMAQRLESWLHRNIDCSVRIR